MDDRDAHLEIPVEGIDWCTRQPYPEAVLEDVVEVDLDWWNDRLANRQIPAQVSGRTVDGNQVWKGKAFIRRGDLEPGVPGLEMGEEPEFDRLYMCAAWLAEHPSRGGNRRFVDIREPQSGRRFEAVERALIACRSAPGLFEASAYRDWSGWPTAPGVGHSLMSLYCWAIGRGGDRPQLLDNDSAGSLTWHGWMVASSVSTYSVRRYVRYNALIHRWARSASVQPELVEMWLNRDWQIRLAETTRRRDGSAL
ncbi:hypothetical protein [Gordonia sp. (in: high G+C Gram-positive bacteria)]|uniref:8-oxoguanine DNA glycosylase OGG fold protein n=1 Tax=Gordonia sp. (in: high G+C Gram-positive bacteria) TaxID=84139 RepID=UPI00169F2D13|nr:hypothetical protein [Gordonia sp. (in: high G+C Gram-positive bacteria)]NLG47810.1 hypothetical protein [Gordonia sp. (in: high G+C Gram-positive bacteria)]